MRNALLGYTYQHYVATLFLTKMDVEREIEKISLEAVVDHKFDDISIATLSDNYFLQIKDFEHIDVSSLVVKADSIMIGTKLHQLSKFNNVIFFKHISLSTTCEIFGFPAQMVSGVYIVSLSRNEIDRKIERLYQKNLRRKMIIEQYFSDRLDKRIFEFYKIQLPTIDTFSTKLIEKTIRVSRNILKVKKILLIEGKPGVGKSHLVGYLEKEHKSTITYRFWVSNQDRDYEERLRYDSFLSDIAKKLFHNFRVYTEDEILNRLKSSEYTFIIDGLDHVENYNSKDLDRYIDFINRVGKVCTTIVLSRPLKTTTDWKKQILPNWNQAQTKKVLADYFYISDYTVASDIYKITDGYPILVRYIAEHYKLTRTLPLTERFDSINDYYEHLLRDEKSKQALALFVCSRGFLMRSELRIFLEEYTASIIEEFVDHNPYLFEIRLNRISLFHDSLITYLRINGINYTSLQKHFTNLVFESIMNGERRFQSRIGHLNLSKVQMKSIVKHYASLKRFKSFIKGVVDFEAVQEFYHQIRDLLAEVNPEDLETLEYYDLSLILNLIQRDHVSSNFEFQYTFTRTLLYNGYTHEDITSSRYLFGMWYYVHTSDSSLLHNLSSNDHYDTEDFDSNLKVELKKEQTFFEFQKLPFDPARIKRVLLNIDDTRYSDYIQYILVNLYLHLSNRNQFADLYSAVRTYMEENEERGIRLLSTTLKNRYIEYRNAAYLMSNVKDDLIAYGIYPERNEYIRLTLREYMDKHGAKGSFYLWPEILSFLRLSLERKRKIDIGSISMFWIKYHMRKDYTLFALDSALFVFEQKKWISWQSSVKLITEIQDVSEKGYRDLLARYISQHQPSFLTVLLDEFNVTDLRISLFDLPPDYIDVLTKKQYETAMIDIFGSSHSQIIDVSDIGNLLSSEKVTLLQRDLKILGYKIRAKRGDRSIGRLDELKIPYVLIEPDKDYREDKTSEGRYNKGIIDLKNIDIIKKKKLSPVMVACTSDSSYTVLAEPNLFHQFPKAKIQREIKQILFSALTAKSKNSDYYNVPWVMPGTVLKIMLDNNITVSKSFFESFKNYLALSIITLKEH